MIKLAPSILSADFSHLGDAILMVERAGAHYLHIDVMDGRFVPNISFGTPIIKSIRGITDMTFDVHLMLSNPEKYIEMFASAGADIINVHVEAVEDISTAVHKINTLHKRSAVTVKPKTNIEQVYEVLDEVDMVLVMSVEPGYGGQELIPETLRKAEKLANFVANKNLLTEIEMDGGIDLSNINDVLSAGVNVVVAGTSVFNADDPEEAVKLFYKAFKDFGVRP